MKLVKPPRLHRGNTVGVFSPSWPVTEDARQKFNLGIQKLKSIGLDVKIAEHTLGKYYYSAGTREERLEDLHTVHCKLHKLGHQSVVRPCNGNGLTL